MALMRTVVGLVIVGWLVQQPWIAMVVVGTILLGAGLAAWTWVQHLKLQAAPVASSRVEPHFEPWTAEQKSSEHSILLRKIEELEHDLKEARREASVLRLAKERLERDLQRARATQAGNRSNPLFRRVGLDENAPEWVAVAVRKAYRKRLHPDVHPASRKADAERRFIEAETVFTEIWRVKGFRS
jgi:hypothetical protein